MTAEGHRSQRAPVSPFFGRAYGAYTRHQADYIRNLYRGHSLKIIDPMAGGGWYLPMLTAMGHRVTAVEVNPVAAALVDLRSPLLLAQVPRIADRLDRVLRKCPTLAPLTNPAYEARWLPESVSRWLQEYGRIVRQVEGPGSRSPTAADTTKVLSYLPLLAARRFATFSQSDNVAWVKPGGLQNCGDPRALIRTVFVEWRSYIEGTYDVTKAGSLVSIVADICRFHTRERFDGVVFSPPYANRLDYVRMWAPEASVYQAVLGEDPFALAPELIGTTIVRGVTIDSFALADLPSPVREALEAIKSDSAKASASYYFPFFANYAIRLNLAIHRAAQLLAKGGVGVIFVRDTPRKDILFPAGLLAKSALQSAGCNVTKAVTHIIRGHIGMRRRREHTSLQGLAQREWWLQFERAT